MHCVDFLITHLTPLDKNVSSGTYEVGSVKAWFEFCGDEMSPGGQLVTIGNALDGVVHVIELITHLRLGGGGPLGTPAEVVLEEGTVGAVLKEPGAPSHGSFDHLFSHDKEKVPGHGGIHAMGGEVGGVVRLAVIQDIRTTDHHSFLFQHATELLDLLHSLFHVLLWEWLPGVALVEVPMFLVRVGLHLWKNTCQKML